jgi:hypothetical protein
MSEVEAFVPDTNVISSLHAVDWLGGVEGDARSGMSSQPSASGGAIRNRWELDPPAWPTL